MIEFREARPEEIETWDDLTVKPPGGHVLQSRAWATYREQAGWHPRYLMGADGSAVLALLKPWPRIKGWSAYLSRGPVPTTDPRTLAARLDGATRYLTDKGVDVVASDPQVLASSGYAAELEKIGFKPIEEIQPSRHRLSVPLGPDLDEEQALARVSKQTRQRIRKAETELRIVRWDKTVLRGAVGDGFTKPEGDLDWALAKFHVMLVETARRRQFEILPRKRFNDWAYASYSARQSLYLEAIDKRDAPVAGLLIYRHGERLSTFLSADFDSTRDAHPGAFHLLRWRAIQQAIREGCSEMDLDGADLAGARSKPEPSDPAYGLYLHKKSFGAEWVELTGAHERVARPMRYLAGRTIANLQRRLRPSGRAR
ncbi:MAG TPA: GNAT family N-acetyltransferase [Candidatus Limnocylindrales bacterium]|nr:GNAT family N-acetyltransferase [Candidatus Limnocylindrales bacterium]